MKLEQLLREIAIRDFDGHNLKGPRKKFIYNWLKENGLNPKEDDYGNIWVEKGKKGDYLLYSSHIDVDRTRGSPNMNFKTELVNNTVIYNGILDNAVGCYLNMISAFKYNAKSRKLYVFSACEEEEPGNPENMSKSAKDVVNILKVRGIKPSLFVVLDANYPNPLVSVNELDENWDNDSINLFDNNDKTPCYIDYDDKNPNGIIAKQLGTDLLSNETLIKIRKFGWNGWDESMVYNLVSPTLFFGPVVYGKMDRPNQRMPKKHLVIAEHFLKTISQNEILETLIKKHQI
ncbi:hypothetical protein J4404_03530 [Candidatus Woesearchaeota archaeon]|nr:hypothetical protein [Candidatus Woesearchaeota archaeon]